MLRNRWSWLAAVSIAAAALVGACQATHQGQLIDDKNTSKSSTGTGAAGGAEPCLLGCGGAAQGGNSNTKVLVIEPKMATLTVDGNMIPTQPFKATMGSKDVTNSVTWVYDKPAIGDMSAAGIFVPSGKVGGIGKLQALYDKAEGEATVEVYVKRVVNPVGVTPAEQMAFDTAVTPDPSLAIVYPSDGTTFPLKVMAPEIQWNGGQTNDLVRLRLSSKYIDYTEYFGDTAPGLKTLDQQAWEDIEFSGTGPVSDPLTVEVARRSGNTVYQAKTLTLHIAQGVIHGSVYYWQLPGVCGGASNGKILRIKPDSAQTDEFFQSSTCWGCHTVSRDGKQMMATFEGGSPFPLQTIDLTKDPAVLGSITTTTGLTGTFSAFNDDSTRILYSYNGSGKGASSTYLQIVDAQTGQFIKQDAIGPGCGEGAWSPDGMKIAAICNMDGNNWTFDSPNGDLQVVDWDKPNDALGASALVVPKGSLAGRPAYPSFSPDSQYLAYGRPTTGSRSTGNGTLWLVKTDGSGAVELKNAQGGGTKSFNPVFAPKGAGGYSWLVFISRRDYGNQMVSQNRQQLWVTAVNDPPGVGDPSHPAFYLRGQEACGKSENAYYALDPCKELGDECLYGIECCNGQCIYDEMLDKYVCGEPDPNECVQTGNACVEDEDCCDFPDVKCIQGFCQKPAPK